MTSAAISPPTMTMAKGRWESEPMPCEVAAGSRPSVATSMVIMMGRRRSDRAFFGGVDDGRGRARAAG